MSNATIDNLGTLSCLLVILLFILWVVDPGNVFRQIVGRLRSGRKHKERKGYGCALCNWRRPEEPARKAEDDD